MRAATLFSGIGAPECARPDWQWLWHAEIEPFPAAVMQTRHPGSLNLGSVLADDFAERAERAGRPDVLVFGSPCQSFSVAGKRLGLSDPRGNLALVALALVRRLRPAWFVFENVPGLLSSERGEDFETFLGAVAESGYSGCWRVLDARYWHLAQRRERVFFVGSLGDWRGPAAVLSLAEGLRGYPEKGREARQRTSPSVIKGAAIGRQPENGPQRGDTLSDGTCFTLNCTEVRAVAHALRAEGIDASEDGTGRGTPLVPVAMNLRGREGGAMPEMADVASLRSASGGSSRSYVAAVHENQRAELTTSDTVGALKSGGGKPGQGYPAVLTQSLQPSTNGGINQRTSTEPADADASETDAGKVLRDLRQSIGAKAFSEWGIGVLASFREAEVLLRAVLCDLLAQGEVGRELVVGAHDVAEQGSARTMREMRSAGRARRSPPQPRSSGQSARELGAYLSELPQQGAPPASLLHDLRRASEGSRLLQQALDTLEEVRRPDGWEDRHEEALRDRGLSGSQPRSRTMQPPCAASETGHALQVRRLTVIECCRLQGFPDLHLMIDRHPNGRRIDAETANYLASHGVKVWQRDEKHGIRWYTAAPADGPMYRAAGNSMAVPVLRWLLTRIEAVEQARSLAA